MKKVIGIILFFATQIVLAQEKPAETTKQQVYKKSTVMKPVKAYMKAEKYNQALTEIDNAFNKFEQARVEPAFYDYKVKAYQQLVLQENRKMYLANKPDTAKYFNYLYEMYDQALRCDSIEQIPDYDGQCKFKYRFENAQILNAFRKNLKVSTNFFYTKKQYDKAYRFVNMYCMTKTAPIFYDKKGQFILPEENDNTEMAVLAVLSAYGSNNNEGVVKYLDEAMKDATTRFQLLELGCKAYFALNDTAQAVHRLREGFMLNPEQEYFFMSLVKYYNSKNNPKESLMLADTMVTKFPNNRDYWFVKAKQEEILGLQDQAIASLNKAVSIKENDAESYSSIGALYSDKALQLYRKNTLSVTSPGYRQFRANLKELYNHAKIAYECAKKAAPDNKALWFDGLRNAYFKLNMGKELKELEKIK
ncbi:MAG: hypothetical protein K6E54_10245 [Bacteroidaceae bacterium]|nr:hypothetical protein [Bacteroidaceae bacterium]